MNTLSTERIDQLALVWLAVRRGKGGPAEFSKQLKNVANGADDRKRLARECVARLRGRGMLEPRHFVLTEAGRSEALKILGLPGIPSKSALQWAKKVLLLRSLGAEPSNAAIKTAGIADVLAARILVRGHKIDHKIDTAKPKSVASRMVAALARRVVGVDEKSPFKLDDVFSAVFLSASGEPESAKLPLRLDDRELPEFASLVTDAARSSVTGRWHDAVFISHVWSTLQGRGDVGITFEKFKRRLVEAYQSDLVELSRADLVEAMPAADVSASETIHSGSRFHFVRVEQLAS